jgi:RNA polymerase sigma-32 factor
MTSVEPEILPAEEAESEDPEVEEPQAEGAEGEATPEGEEPSLQAAPLPLAPSSHVTVSDPLRRYLWEISRFELLSREKESELARRFQEAGDAEAAATLVKANLRLVVKIALDFQRFWVRNLLDLIQEGNLGLMQAVRKFDPFRGIKFSYYASFWIKAYILKFIMDNWKLVKVGTTQAQRRLFYNLKKEKERLQAQGFEATPKLLAQNLDVQESEVIEMDQRLDGWELSLEAPLKEDGKDSYKDFLPAKQPSVEDEVAGEELRSLLSDKLERFRKTLTGKERIIFDQRLMADPPATLQEVGEKFDISRERVRQIQARLVKKIGQFLEAEIPDFRESYSNLGE